MDRKPALEKSRTRLSSVANSLRVISRSAASFCAGAHEQIAVADPYRKAAATFPLRKL
jgi:hypothetical protein